VDLLSYADQRWKQGGWPPPAAEHFVISLAHHRLHAALDGLIAVFSARTVEARTAAYNAHEEKHAPCARVRDEWQGLTDEERVAWGERAKAAGLLIEPPVPGGTAAELEAEGDAEGS
jgi:hypothetical protein